MIRGLVTASLGRKARGAACLLIVATPWLTAQTKESPLTVRVANQVIVRWPDGHLGPKNAPPAWGFELGFVLAGMNAVWRATNDAKYLDYVQHGVDQFVRPDGAIAGYDSQAYSLNNILIGRQLLTLYRATHQERYKLGAEKLRQQIASQPRTASGGVWHSRATPNLMLLDDQFMLAPFYAQYAATFQEPQDLDDIVKQFALLEQHTRDAATGLMYHGWDESHAAPWANRNTGTSPNLWARGMGWYLMALVDTLPYVPERDPQHAVLLAMLHRAAAAVERAQDPQSSLWYQILNKPGEKGNYIESSSVLMFTYAFAKGARLGYLPKPYGTAAVRAWKAARLRFIRTTAPGEVKITSTVTHIALGASPADDGSDDYYLHAPVVDDDPKGVGAFLLAGSEMELLRHRPE
ncbi:MAG: unsaturated rhamnogalacturonyl hydrolase [Acidobacteriaceae bacterium]|jgi:unsaturated rhamnogalacturonyl hydrolase|nr:unsaturated rhamnogalacturonyl hydrolase [Acidobacteriaceae bacterium]